MSSSGVNFPVDGKGQRSTTEINRGAFIAAVEKTDSSLAAEIKGVRNWRHGYSKHVTKQVELACKSRANALNIANDGLNYLHNTMRFERDGDDISLSEAMKKFTSGGYETGFIKGTGKKGSGKAEVPYQGKVLTGHALSQQIDTWVTKGVIEMSAGQAMQNVVEHEEWTDLSDQTFVLFGAGSAMGPYPLLMALGANVIALDLDRPGIWQRLFKIAKDSPGTLTFPMREKVSANDEAKMAEVAGCNLLTATPEIRNWLLDVKPEERLICGAYAYLDGPLFLRVSMAMDAIIADLQEKRKVKIGVAYLCTPTDAHVIPAAANAASVSNLKRAPMWQHLFMGVSKVATPKMALTKNSRRPTIDDQGEERYIVDAVVNDQGPNYILAKRLQHWRAIVSKEDGCLVSTNIAPATATASVVSNKLFALAYKGQHHFKPLEVSQQETSNAVMGMLLVNDLRNPLSVASPTRKLKNPMDLFTENSFHGGSWRCGFKYGSIGFPAILSAVYTEYIMKTYLLAYNFVQLFISILSIMAAMKFFTGEGSKDSIWKLVGPTCTLSQWLMILEIVHPMLGMVRASVGSTAIQVFSRILLASVMNMADISKDKDDWYGTFYPACFIAAWSVTETIRYSFFGLNLLSIECWPIKWCRYTFFILLYPLGVTGELGTIAMAFDKILKYKGGNLLIKSMAFVGNYLGGYYTICFLYALGLPFLYLHMFSQRGNVMKKRKESLRNAAAKKKQ